MVEGAGIGVELGIGLWAGWGSGCWRGGGRGRVGVEGVG